MKLPLQVAWRVAVRMFVSLVLLILSCFVILETDSSVVFAFFIALAFWCVVLEFCFIDQFRTGAIAPCDKHLVDREQD